MPIASRATEFTPAWVTAQRWFRAKQREVASVEPFDEASLPGGARLVVLRVEYADGGDDRYLTLAVGGEDGRREVRDGDGGWAAMVRLMASGADVAGRAGRFRFGASSALAELLPSASIASVALDERRLGVEQTNTSVLLGDRLILKLYRLLELGDNPEVEVGRFLTEVGFEHTPALAGWAEYLPRDGVASAVAMLQAMVPAGGDAWASALQALRTPDSAPTATAMVARIGEITRELHDALASRPQTPGFEVRRAAVDDLTGWRSSAEHQLDAAVAAAPEHVGPLRAEINARLDAMLLAGGTRVSRIHGDYHLGQLLRAADGRLWVIDFEGEPARPLAERRRLASPMRDLAGMRRSLDYAARSAAQLRAGHDLEADTWQAEARRALQDGYGPVDDAETALLDAFEIEKACYEVGYEAAMRPDWLWLPVQALQRLCEHRS
jgi:trehalose synthase-fused probable maltokinase